MHAYGCKDVKAAFFNNNIEWWRASISDAKKKQGFSNLKYKST